MRIVVFLPRFPGRVPSGEDPKGARFCEFVCEGDGTLGKLRFHPIAPSERWQDDEQLARFRETLQAGIHREQAELQGGMDSDGQSVLSFSTTTTHAPWTRTNLILLIRSAIPKAILEIEGGPREEIQSVYQPAPGVAERLASARAEKPPTARAVQSLERMRNSPALKRWREREGKP